MTKRRGQRDRTLGYIGQCAHPTDVFVFLTQGMLAPVAVSQSLFTARLGNMLKLTLSLYSLQLLGHPLFLSIESIAYQAFGDCL